MTKTDTGGPAFPCEVLVICKLGEYRKPHAGMTLRDYFAAKALQGLMGGRWKSDTRGQWYDAYRADADEWAKSAYHFADAMLKARNQE